MIYCPHCGTPNKPNSKFCKNCAALLAPSTDVRCPICGTMNAQSAETCQNCGTRLSTSAAGALNSTDQTTPADTPEQISPFNPPSLSNEKQESDTGSTTPTNRPSFARANSEWLRRVQKTPPAASKPATPPSEIQSALAPVTPSPSSVEIPPAPPSESPAATSMGVASTDWLKALDAASKQEAETSAATTADSANEPATGLTTDAAAPVAVESPFAEAMPSGGTEPIGEAEMEPPAADTAPSAALTSEPSPMQAKPVLSEIKLTGDDYDYSDIAGTVTDEMKAQIDASASNLSTTEDEVALARRLLGLDVETPTTASPVTEATTVASSVAALPMETPPPAAIETPVAAESVTDTAAVASSAAALLLETPPPAAIETPVAAESVAPAPPTAAVSEIVPAPETSLAVIASEQPIAEAKPVLSEIKLTGDDYDYSDIAGTVTDEMKAQLDASASNLSTTEDEVALARRLLGLDVETPTAASTVTEAATVAPSAVALPMESPPPAAVETPVAAEPAAPTAAVSEIVPALETPSATIASEPPIAEAKPVLSEIKLTGDDYDYSDIAGTVTDEMKAQLDASASNLSTTEDEVALARRLLGLDVETPTAASPVADVPVMASSAAALPMETPPPAAIETSVPPPAATLVEPVQQDEKTPNWLTALAAASSAAIAGEAIQQTAETASTLSAPIAAQEPSVAETISEPATAQAPSEPVAADEISLAGLPPGEKILKSGELKGGDLPEWLRELAPREFIADKPAADNRAPEAFTASETEAEAADTIASTPPEWVKDLAPGVGTSTTAAMLSHLPDLDELERGDLPEWLREPPEPPKPPAPPVADGTPPPAAVPSTSEPVAHPTRNISAREPQSTTKESDTVPELLPALELPSWFTDSMPGASGTRDPFETIETSGPLAGVSGILPLALAITEAHTLTSAAPARSDGGRIFQTILAEPLAAASQARRATGSASLIRPQHVIYLIILVAALVPLFLPLDQAGIGLEAAKSPTALFYDQLQSVPANGTVLLAFEYTPGEAVELDPAARAIVNDLAAHKVNVIALSTQENGATLGQTILSRTQEAQPQFTFVNIGYLTGNAAGLRSLAKLWLPSTRPDVNGASWGASPLASKIHGMDDLALTVLLVGNSNTLQTWMEQVQPSITSPLVAATSAQLEPQARNYVNSKQLTASLRGLTGAAELELLTNSAGQAVKTVDAYSFVSLALAGIIIAANIMWLLNRGKKKT